MSIAPAPPPQQSGVADLCAVVPSVVANQSATLAQLHTLLLHRRRLARDTGTAHLDFASLSHVLWTLCERFGARPEAAIRSAAPAAILEVSAAAAVLAELLAPASHAKLVATQPDVDCAVKLSRAAVVHAKVPLDKKQPATAALSSSSSSPVATAAEKVDGALRLPSRAAVAFTRAAWVLLSAVAGADSAAVLRHVKDTCWAAAQQLPVGCSIDLLKASEAALCVLVADRGISNRFDIAAEVLAAFPGDQQFAVRAFVGQHTSPPPTSARVSTAFAAPAPLAFNGLQDLVAALAKTTVAVRKAAGGGGHAHQLDDAIRKAIDVARKSSGTFSTAHLGLVVALGDRGFLGKLLAKRLVAAAATHAAGGDGGSAAAGPAVDVDASDSAIRVRLPFAEHPLPLALVDAPSSDVATLLVAAALAATAAAVKTSTAPAGPAAPLASLLEAPLADVAANDGAAMKLVALYFQHVLRSRSGDSPIVSVPGPAVAVVDQPAGVHLMRLTRHVVVEIASRNRAAQSAWVSRVVATAEWATGRCRDGMNSTRYVHRAASHAYALQAAFRSAAQAIAESSGEALQQGVAAGATSGAPTGRVVPLSGDDALSLVLALSQLQPACLIHRSTLNASRADAKKVAAEDWRLLRVVGYYLVNIMTHHGANILDAAGGGASSAAASPSGSSTPSPPGAERSSTADATSPVARLVRHVRTLTQTPGMDRDFFVSEPLYFLTTVLNHKGTVKSVSEADMESVWVPAALRCILATSSPALRRSGQILLAVPMVERHPSALRIFPTYVNVFVSSPRSRAQGQLAAAAAGQGEGVGDSTISYGPVPDDSLKLFSGYFRTVAAAIERVDAPHRPVGTAVAAGTGGGAASAGASTVDGPQLLKWAVRQLVAVAGYHLALAMPGRDDVQRRRIYFCTLIDCLQLSNPIALDAACAGIEKLLLGMPLQAEATIFLDYASGVVQASQSVATKKSMAEWLLDLRDKLAARHPPHATRSKL